MSTRISEGHGFSRATDSPCLSAALAAEVRFFPAEISGESRNQCTSGAKQAAEKPSASPEGTAESSPGRQSWEEKQAGCTVPSGTAERRSTGFQPSLTGLDPSRSVNPGLASWATFSRPFGTCTEFFRNLFSPQGSGSSTHSEFLGTTTESG